MGPASVSISAPSSDSWPSARGPATLAVAGPRATTTTTAATAAPAKAAPIAGLSVVTPPPQRFLAAKPTLVSNRTSGPFDARFIPTPTSPTPLIAPAACGGPAMPLAAAAYADGATASTLTAAAPIITSARAPPPPWAAEIRHQAHRPDSPSPLRQQALVVATSPPTASASLSASVSAPPTASSDGGDPRDGCPDARQLGGVRDDVSAVPMRPQRLGAVPVAGAPVPASDPASAPLGGYMTPVPAHGDVRPPAEAQLADAAAYHGGYRDTASPPHHGRRHISPNLRRMSGLSMSGAAAMADDLAAAEDARLAERRGDGLSGGGGGAWERKMAATTVGAAAAGVLLHPPLAVAAYAGRFLRRMARYPLRQLSFVQDDAGYRRFPASQSGTRPSWRHRGRRWIQRHQALCDQLWFCSMCVLWYMSSAMTNNLGKQVMMAWRHPVTLTFVQFGFVALFCQIVAATTGAFGRLQPLNVSRFVTVVPLSIFQVTGHIFSSVAISRIPVSLVHTVKALSPLFTVLIYRIVLKRAVSHRVALSLIPLTCGVVLVTMTPHVQFNAIGLTCALASTIVFVLQNIVSKKLFDHHANPGGSAHLQQHQHQHQYQHQHHHHHHHHHAEPRHHRSNEDLMASSSFHAADGSDPAITRILPAPTPSMPLLPLAQPTLADLGLPDGIPAAARGLSGATAASSSSAASAAHLHPFHPQNPQHAHRPHHALLPHRPALSTVSSSTSLFSMVSETPFSTAMPVEISPSPASPLGPRAGEAGDAAGTARATALRMDAGGDAGADAGSSRSHAAYAAVTMDAGLAAAADPQVSLMLVTPTLAMPASPLMPPAVAAPPAPALGRDPRDPDPHHLSKLSMLFWASTFAFVLMFPLWLYYDRVAVADLWRARRASSSGAPPPRAAPGMGIPMLLVLNGASHFAQNVLAFYLLGLTSPVTYSIASLVKRIFVISAAMLYFGDRVNAVQGAGIVLTFGGLWLYQSAKGQKGSH